MAMNRTQQIRPKTPPKEDSFENDDDSFGGEKSADHKCLSCNAENSIALECRHMVCGTCLSNQLEQLVFPEIPRTLNCLKCDKCIKVKVFKDLVFDDTLLTYLQLISQLPRTKNISENSDCEMCGEDHSEATTCEVFYRTTNFPNEILTECCICHNPKGITLPCCHTFCHTCLIERVKSLIDQDPFVPVTCKTCEIPFPISIIYELFGGKNVFINYQNLCIDNTILAPVKPCVICMETFIIKELTTLDCNHRFCKACTEKYIISKIMNFQVLDHELSCPECQIPINYEIIKAHVPVELFKKYQHFTIKQFQPDIDDETIMKWCYKCDFGMLIEKDMPYFHCPSCNASYCPKCNTKHIGTFACPDIRKSLSKSELEEKIGVYASEFMKDVLVCPNCNEGVFKEKGCNFIQCKWPRCKDVYFCAICKIRLDVRAI